MSDLNQSEKSLTKSFARAVWIVLAVIATWLVVDLILALTGANGFSGVFDRGAESNVAEQSDSLSLLEDGYWTIAGDDQPIAVSQIDEVELAEKLRTPPPAGLPSLKNSQALTTKLRLLMQGKTSSQQLVGEYTRLQLELPDVRAVLYTRVVDDQQQLVAASAAVRGDDRWMLFETRAGHSIPATTDGIEKQPLLPQAESLTPLAVRYDLNGERQSELSSGAATSGQLLEYWRDAGWSITDAPVTAAGDAQHYLCSKANQTVYVWLKRQQGQIVVFAVVSPPAAG